jgi:curved DNA-binding protein
MDYYKVLEVKKDASTAQITAIFLKILRKHHPDRNLPNGKEVLKRFVMVSDCSLRTASDL